MKKIFLLSVLAFLTASAFARTGDDWTEGPNRFLGLNATITSPIAGYHNPDYRVEAYGSEIKIGVDCAYRIADRFALGFYVAIGGGPVFSKRVWASDNFVDPNGIKPGFDLRAGVLMLVGDLAEKPFIIGVAPCTGFGMFNPNIYLPVEARFGRELGKGFYLTGNLTVGVPLAYHDGTESYYFIEPAVSIGYNFGPRKRDRK